MAENEAKPVIVVGADGTELSVEAVRWAARQAALVGADLRVVTAFDIPATIFVVPTYTEADYVRDADDVLERTIREALGPEPGVRVERVLSQERPAHALTTEAEGAELLVVGSHGRKEFPRMHLGSVATYCVHHAPCPVVVVRRRSSDD
jgi:nucleotide-binding universal stress UspA family protein